MIFRNEHDGSYVPKIVIAVAIAGSIFMSGYLMFFEESEIIPLLKAYKIHGNCVRNILVISCFCIYFLRLLITLFVFFQRKMYWLEALVIANIMPWIIPYIAYVAGRSNESIGLLELLGILLFFIGSSINTASELLRHLWKRREENRGHLYTGGLFHYAVHINYFGDIVLFTGLAAIAHQVEALIIPVSMGLMFTLILIPLKETYLKQKYGQEFYEYASTTKKLVPIVY
jgi:protein-S-isoprenylcysteine O-methyltransferase Ste14